MFIVFNKEKIYSYIVALSTIVVLFMIANIVVERNQDAIATSSVDKLLPIYSVDTNEKKVALTMNCAWSQLPMG